MFLKTRQESRRRRVRELCDCEHQARRESERDSEQDEISKNA